MIFRKLAAALGLLGLLLPAAAGAQATSSGPTARIYVPAIAANGGTGNNITLNGTTNITGTASNAVTQPFTDASARIATDAYVQSVQQVTRSTVYLNGVTGGTLSFASLGTGAAFSFTATGGVITSINSVFAGGSGYKVGDVIYITRGNYDNYILVTGVSGTAVTTVQILNGGTGNTSGLDVSAMAAIESPIIYNVSGTLTSNLQVIASNGPVLGYSGVFLLINNTTGNYTESVCISNGSDACNGNGSVQIPQGAANSCATLTYTDGATPWIAAKPLCATGSAIFTSSGSGVIPAGATQIRILAVGGGSSGAGGTTVAATGSGGGSGGVGSMIRSDWLPLSTFGTNNYTVTIGAGGTTASAGAAGNVGGNTTVVIGSFTFTAGGATTPTATAGASGATSTGGTGGGGVFTATPIAGNVGNSTLYFNAIATAGDGTSAVGVTSTANTRMGPCPGGSGGALNTGVATAGNAGGAVQSAFGIMAGGSSGSAGGGNGGNAAANANWPVFDGAGGGGGGGGNAAGTGGNGGTGGQPGGGGGGGGSGTTGGGTGGAGGAGAVFIEWQ